MRRDLLRWDDSSLMKDMMNKMLKNRVDDKIAFKNMPNNDPDKKRGQSTSKGNSSSTRPLSEPTTSAINKKSINYRIKKKVMKR